MTMTYSPARGQIYSDASPVAAKHQLLPDWMTVAVLVVILPLFGQFFYYNKHWTLVYLPSKAWPVVVVLFALRCLAVHPPPGRALFLVLLAYTMSIAPIRSMIEFDESLIDAMVTTVKVWPFTYYFALLGMLVILRPTEAQLRSVVLMLGVATLAALVLSWVLIPEHWYDQEAVGNKFLLREIERGYRIYLSWFFMGILLFYMNRRFAAERKIWLAAGILAFFAIVIIITKQRAPIGAAVLVTFLTLIPPRSRRLAITLTVTGGAVVTVLAMFSSAVERVAESIGGSLWVRTESLRSALGYMGDDPLSWLIGKGTTAGGNVGKLGEIIGNDFFFLSDIGWFGIFFEYGLVGVALILTTYLGGFHIARKAGERAGDPFTMALGDYILFMVIQSAVYSLVYLPGEFASALAIAVYIGYVLHEKAGPSSAGSADAIHSVQFRAAPQRIFFAPSTAARAPRKR